MLKRPVVMARIAAITGETLTPADLRRMNSGTLRDARIAAAQAAHLATTNKQDAARICIRHLDDDGTAAAADLYMVDCHLPTLELYREPMFPGAAPYVLIQSAAGDASGTPAVTPKDGAASRASQLLLTTALARLTLKDLEVRCGLRPGDFARTISTHLVRDAMQARGWSETTRKALGMPGKGKVLVRST